MFGISLRGFWKNFTRRSCHLLWPCAVLVLLVAMHLALFSFWHRQAQNALHLGRYGPEGLLRHGAHRPDCKLWSLRSCSPSLVVDISFAVQRQSLMVQTIQLTIEIHWTFVFGGRCPCLQVHFFRRGAEADSMVQTVRRTFFFPSEHGGRCPCCAGRACHTVVVNDRCARLRLCRILWWSRSYCSSSSLTIPFCYAEVDPHGLVTMGIPPLQYFSWWSTSLLQVVQISLSWRRGLSLGPDCLDHRDFAVAVLRHGDRCPCCAGREVSAPSWWRQSSSHSCHC